MLTNEDEVITQETDTETTENTDVETEEVDVDSLKKEIATLTAQKEHWRKKASEPKEEKEAPKGDLPVNDIIYLSKVDIHEEDVNEVLTYSKKMGVTVKQAHEFMKPILQVRAEQRKTDEATETKSPRKATQKDPESILQKAESTGEIPEGDAELRALIQARLNRKRGK